MLLHSHPPTPIFKASSNIVRLKICKVGTVEAKANDQPLQVTINKLPRCCPELQLLNVIAYSRCMCAGIVPKASHIETSQSNCYPYVTKTEGPPVLTSKQPLMLLTRKTKVATKKTCTAAVPRCTWRQRPGGAQAPWPKHSWVTNL